MARDCERVRVDRDGNGMGHGRIQRMNGAMDVNLSHFPHRDIIDKDDLFNVIYTMCGRGRSLYGDVGALIFLPMRKHDVR